MNNNRIILLFAILVIVLRLLPHPSNVAPMVALAVMTGLLSTKKTMLLVPIIATIVTDLVLGFSPILTWVYGSYAVIAVLFFVLRRKNTPLSLSKVIPFSLFSATFFYLVTNFGVWLTTEMYQKTFEGLIQCYVMALPFFRNALVGDVFYGVVFYGLFLFLASRRENSTKNPAQLHGAVTSV